MGKKKIVQVAERILKLLKDNDLSYIMKIKSRFVGFHRRNRYGDGINAIDAIDLIKEIFDVGFSRTMVKPMCFEISAADTETHSINNYVAEAASGMLAPCPIGSLKFASVGCGHTNQGIRAIDAECMCDSAPEMTMDGKFNLDKIKAADPNLADAVIEGLDWLVICSEVEEAFPELPEILQEALNIMNQLARPESELQIMCKMHSMARSLQTLNECIDWAAIVAKCSRSKPRCSEDLQDERCALAQIRKIREHSEVRCEIRRWDRRCALEQLEELRPRPRAVKAPCARRNVCGFRQPPTHWQ